MKGYRWVEAVVVEDVFQPAFSLGRWSYRSPQFDASACGSTFGRRQLSAHQATRLHAWITDDTSKIRNDC